MSLVHGNHFDRHPLDRCLEGIGLQAFGRHIEEAELRVEHRVGEGVLNLAVGHAGEDGSGLDTPFP